jgi:hypothetical protein
MAVLAVYEQIEESGGRSADGYSFARNYIVAIDGPTDVITVLEAARIPRKGDLHPSGKSSCVSVNATNDGDLWWEVVATYEPIETATGGGGAGENGVGQPELTISSRGRQVASVKDHFGGALLNSAGDALEPDVFDTADSMLTITANIPFESVSFALVEVWRDVVHGGNVNKRIANDPSPNNVLANNPAPFLGYFGGGVVKCTNIGASPDNAGDVTRWNLSIQFELSDSWLGSALDYGIHRLAAPAFGANVGGSPGLQQIVITTRQPIIDANGVPVAKPVLLNGAGQPLAAGQPFYIVWQRYKHGNLNQLLGGLGLPTTLDGYKVVRT